MVGKSTVRRDRDLGSSVDGSHDMHYIQKHCFSNTSFLVRDGLISLQKEGNGYDTGIESGAAGIGNLDGQVVIIVINWYNKNVANTVYHMKAAST